MSFVSPLVGTLDGGVYLGTPQPGAPMRLFVFASKGQVEVKLVVKLRKVNEEIEVSKEDNPFAANLAGLIAG